MKILITGGSGFIGRNLAELLVHPETPKPGVPGTSIPTAPGNPTPRYQVATPSSAELDLLKEQDVREYLAAHHFDVMVHAATTRSNRRVGASAEMLDHNCRMFFNLARNESAFGKLIFFGSGAEYGPRAFLPARVREDYFDTRVPTEPYGFSKYICAKYMEARGQSPEARGRFVELRLFAVFGPHEDYTVRFISNACCRAVKGLPIVLRQDAMFDYLYVKDLAEITRWFIENDAKHGAYNVCSGKPVALSELGRIVSQVSAGNRSASPQSFKPTARAVETPELHPFSVTNPGMGEAYTGDNSRLLGEMGGYRFWDLREAIADLYSWYEEREGEIDGEALRFDE
jgi:UDP-glucose 4-epimerase